MTQRISGHEAFFYFTNDMTKSVLFYRDHMGLEFLGGDDYWSLFQMPDGGKFGLHGVSTDNFLPVKNGMPMIIFRSEDVKSTVAWLMQHGATIARDPVIHSWGEEADMYDPCGNCFRIGKFFK
ncbi:MAG: VOC family protein [Pararobbsia sp.]